ncbi:hypothetical protein AWU67_09750 [Microterricola viridarii]|uniref:DUF1648 domain-containing protein n=2 Tax=Microterricola viridarii TaxID=412690 RepID=A0A0X8E2W8_9MICO|nr:hypothetical protein AWU67_09750 [Microterricola viridarii]
MALPPPRRWPFFAAAGYLCVVLGVGIALFPAAPDPMPVHFDAAFQPDRWAPKSLVGFLSPVFVGLGVAALMWTLAALMPVLSSIGGGQGHPAPGVQLSPRPPAATRTVQLTRRMLERLALSVALLIGTVALLGWLGVPDWAAPWALVLLVGGFLGVLAFSVVGIVGSERSASHGLDA